MTPRLLICAGLIGALGLGACGKRGTLDRPGPLFGQRAEHRAQRDAAARANSEPNAASSATSQTNGDYSHASDGAKDPALQPLRNNPPPGMQNGPLTNGGGGGGVLPDPFADPNRAPR